MNQQLEQRILACTTLPSLPAVAVDVLRLTDDDSTGMDDLAKVISVDAALSACILRAVNSSFYGLNQKVASINQAVVLLGLRAVQALVLGFSLVTNPSRQKRGFDHLPFWRRSMYSAFASRVIANRVLPRRSDDCFVAALLADVGSLVLDQVLGAQYGEIYARAKNHNELLALETCALGLTHADAGALLARHWRLPEAVQVAIQHHHRAHTVEDFIARKMCEVVGLAGRCADVFVDEESAESIISVRRAFLEMYGIRVIECDSLLCETGQKTAELASLFEVKINAAVNYADIVSKASERLLALSSMAEQSDETAPSDRSRSDRARRSGTISLIPYSQGVLGEPTVVSLNDVSSRGIGIVHRHPLDPGSQFVIELPQPGGLMKSLHYTVIHCQPSTCGSFVVGARLSSVLQTESLNLPGGASDARVDEVSEQAAR